MRRLSALLFIAACTPNSAGGLGETKDDPSNHQDITDALAALPEVTVLDQTPDGMPRFIVGELGKVGAMQNDDALQANNALMPALPPVLAVFRLEPSSLQLRRMNVDDDGNRHFRYTQVHDGLPVIGGDMIVHVDVKGAINAANGTARGDISPTLGKNPITESTAMNTINSDGRFSGLASTGVRPVFIQTDDGVMHKAYEATMEGKRGADPARDKVFVDMDNGAIVAVHPTIHFAKNRRTHSANNGTTLPGTLRRTEGQAPVGDTAVDRAHDNSGDVYDTYFTVFSRDSIDNAGMNMVSTAHYSTNYCNAFWNGTQMTYGDGNASQNCAPLANSLDVAGHEITHGVTEKESGLTYSGESGGLNESLSDVFGAFIESWVDGGRNGTNYSTANDVFLIGDEVLPPFLRSMCDPAADGVSRDVWSSSLGSVDVHYSSGPNNLVFCLLAKGGTHPRGKTTVNVPAIGILKAATVMYRANRDFLTSSSNYAAMRTASEQAATAAGFDQATKDAVGCAYAAISVGTAPASCGGAPPPPPPTDGVLANNVPQGNLSGAADSQKFWSFDVPAGQTSMTITINGGTGDADLYVQFGTKPTLSSYQCRPYKAGNSETCTFSPPQQGKYFVMLHAYSAYSGVTLTGSYSATTSGDPYLTNGVAVTGISGAASSNQYWRIATPAGKTLTVRITGGTGDADMYTRVGARPTTTTYGCRPYLNGNNETCTHSNTTASDYYVMLRGYTSFSGVSLVASY